MNYATLTENGLNEINQAHPLGEYIEIAYYLPVYDYRIDGNIGVTDTTVLATQIETVTNSADTVPTGEIIWNTPEMDAYGLTDDLKYLIYTGNETTATSGAGFTVSDYVHRNPYAINLYKSSALSNHMTADTVISPGNIGTYWFLSNAGYDMLTPPTSADGYGPQDWINPTSDKLFKGVTYQHVITSANDSRANFKVTMRCPVGQIKFNKIGLYAVKRTEDGTIATDPFLFAQVIIPETQVMYSNQTGSNAFAVSELTLDFQIETKAVSADFENVFYSTSGDYWVRTTNESNGQYGILYDGTVYITNRLAVDDRGNFLNTSADRGVSKLFVSTYERINQPITSAEQDMPQLCLQYVENGNLNRIRTTMKTNVSGDCEFDLYGACTSGHGGRYSLIPAIDKEYGLGLASNTTLNANRWFHLYLSDQFEMFDDSYNDVLNSSSYRGFYAKMNSYNHEARFGNGNIFCGPYYSSAMPGYTDANDKAMFSPIENNYYMHGNISSYRASAAVGTGTATVTDDLFVRSLGNMVMVTLNEDDADKNWATANQLITRIWNVKDNITPDIRESLGVDKDIAIVAGRNIYTYGNILPLLHGRDELGEQYRGFEKLWVKRLGYAKSSSTETFNAIQCDTGLVPTVNEAVHLGDNTYRWGNVWAKEIGHVSKYVDKGYLNEINTLNVNFNKTGRIKFHEGLEINGNVLYSDNPYDLGKNDKRISTLYVDNIVLTNGGDTFSVTINFGDITGGAIGGDKIREETCIMTFVVTTEALSNVVTIATTTDKISAREPSGGGGTYSSNMSNRRMMTVNKFAETILNETGLNGNLKMLPNNLVTGLPATEYKNDGSNPSGGTFSGKLVYNSSNDTLTIYNEPSTRWNANNYWRLNYSTINFTLS